MAITVTDIQLLESERLTDAANGGGRMTGSVVDSGEVNNLFPDISRLDRTYGRMALRKAFMAVRSLNTDVYLGAHVIVTDPPNDERVNVTLFSTGSPVDERQQAQNRIEAYVTRGPLSAYVLFGTQPQGAKAVTLMGRTETPLPEVGQVIVLSLENAAGVVSAEQYVRISDVKTAERTFTDANGDYTRQIVTVSLTSALRRTFEGSEASRFSNVATPTRVRDTTIADASRYYGVTALLEDAPQNSLEITIRSIFSQLVPSTTREVPFAGARPGLTLNHIAIGGERTDVMGNTDPAFALRGIVPRSVRGGTSGAGAITGDSGAGELLAGTTAIGAVDYESGRVSGTPVSGLTYTPGVAVQANGYTFGVPIDMANQGTVYVQTMPVAPAPGTTRVDYRYLGRWYTLTDKRGDGALEGATPSEGGGTVDYISGNVVVTLGALPDIGSRVIFSAGQNADYTQRGGTLTPGTPAVAFTLATPPEPSAGVTLSWESGGTTRTATVASNGTISGDATGSLTWSDGYVQFAPAANAWPDSGSTLIAAYIEAQSSVGTVTGTYGASTVTLQLPGAGPWRPGSVRLRIPVAVEGRSREIIAADDGAGAMIGAPQRHRDEAMGVDGGSIDYATGAVTVQIGLVGYGAYRPVGWRGDRVPAYMYSDTPQMPEVMPDVQVQVWASRATAGTVPREDEVAFPGITIALARGTTDDVVAGSVWFAWGGKEYVDRQGRILRDVNRATGAGIDAGSINYTTGEVHLTNYGTTTGGAVALRTLLTQHGRLPAGYIVFRTPGAPVRAGSVYVQAVRADTGTLISGTSTTNGSFTGAYLRGSAAHEMGWVEVWFGEYVPAAGNENEPWYNPEQVVGPNVWKPIPVDPDTIRFNAVVLSSLPLDANLLGIDPVRLPQTGQVPIVREGDVIVVHEEVPHTLPGALTAGQVIQLPEAPVSQALLVDATGAAVPLAQYTVDNITGRITMATPLDLAGLTQPLRAMMMVEDMVVVSGVDLSGRLQLVAPLSRSYGAGARVSSALLYGDLRAADPVFFSQATWTSVWSDDRIGNNTTAQYNRTLYPVELQNADTETERWALIFTGPTGGNIVGETRGVIGTFTTGADVAPLNPITGRPHFRLRAEGFGAGWAPNNVLRINTDGPNAPIWIARTVLPGAQALTDDRFQLQMRGDAD